MKHTRKHANIVRNAKVVNTNHRNAVPYTLHLHSLQFTNSTLSIARYFLIIWCRYYYAPEQVPSDLFTTIFVTFAITSVFISIIHNSHHQKEFLGYEAGNQCNWERISRNVSKRNANGCICKAWAFPYI